MIEVNLEISGSSNICPRVNSIVKYVIKTFWCTREIEDRGELLQISLPRLPFLEYTRQKNSGTDIVLFIELWHIPKPNKHQEQQCFDPVFVGLSRYLLQQLIDRPYLNPALTHLVVDPMFENGVITPQAKIYVKISAITSSYEESYHQKDSVFSISRKSLTHTDDFTKTIPPDIRQRVHEALATAQTLDNASNNNNKNSTSTTNGTSALLDNTDDENFLRRQSTKTLSTSSHNKNGVASTGCKNLEQGGRTQTAATRLVTKFQSSSASKEHQQTPSPLSKSKKQPVQKLQSKTTIHDTNATKLKQSHDSKDAKKNSKDTENKKSAGSNASAPVRVPFAISHDLLTSPDFPFQIPAVRAVEKRYHAEFTKGSRKLDKGPDARTNGIPDSPPLFTYTPHHAQSKYPVTESSYATGIESNPTDSLTRTRGHLGASAEELVAFLNDSFNKTYGNAVEEIKSKKPGQLFDKRDEKASRKLKLKPTKDANSEPDKPEPELEDVLSVVDLGHESNVNFNNTNFKNNGKVPSSVKINYASTATKPGRNNNMQASSSLSSYVPGMSITKYKTPCDRSDKLASPFRSPSKRRLAANFQYPNE